MRGEFLSEAEMAMAYSQAVRPDFEDQRGELPRWLREHLVPAEGSEAAVASSPPPNNQTDQETLTPPASVDGGGANGAAEEPRVLSGEVRRDMASAAPSTRTEAVALAATTPAERPAVSGRKEVSHGGQA